MSALLEKALEKLSALPPDEQDAIASRILSSRRPTRCERAYRLFRANPAHPDLQFKKLEGEDNIYSARIGLGYRALAVMNRIASCGIELAVMPIMIGWCELLALGVC